MATSEAQICNAALARIGAEPIASLDKPESTTAKYCKELFAQTRDYLLRRFEWDFAIKRQALAQPSITNKTDYDNVYTVPDHCIRVIDLLDEDGNNTDDKWIMEDRYIYTDLDDAMLHYIFQITDVRKFDAGFSNALAARLAFLLCLKVTGNNALRQQVYREYLLEVGEAEGLDAREAKSELNEPKLWTDAH